MTANDLYQEVTNTLVAALEAGNITPWRCPWQQAGGGFPLRHNGIPYRGGNTLWLWMTASAKGYASPYFLTFKQALEYGGAVRKGEKSTAILWCEPRTKKTTAEDGTEGEDRFFIAKTYRVFNAEQCDSLPERFTVRPAHGLDQAERIAHAEAFLANTGAHIRHGGGGAFYRPSEDFINLPAFEAFESPEAYYGTALHEAIHWTGHASRLDRDLKGFGNRESYAREEIVAELGSVFSCAALGIAPPDLGQHAAYIRHWIDGLKADPRYLFTAASKAQTAADYLAALQPRAEAA